MSKFCKKCRTEVRVNNIENAEGYVDKYRWIAACDCVSVESFGFYSSAIKKWEAAQRKRSKESNDVR
jgi:hypothetical protein